jgi:hypothetical protein
MRKTFNKIVFPVFLIIIMSLTMVVSSAADEYDITIAADRLTAGVDECIQLHAEVEGVLLQPKIEWSSSDESVAVVNAAGVVTVISEGEAVITATATVGGEEISAEYPVRLEHEGTIVNKLLSQHSVLTYRFDTNYGGFYYNDDKISWQKYVGFGKVYDYFAPMVAMEYDFLRVFFPYDGKEFMLEFWKGRYGAFIGCEVGIYHRNNVLGLKRDSAMFACAKEKYWPVMDMGFYRQMEEGDAPEDYKLEFRRAVDRYWWCTGFIPGELRELRPADELRIEATLTFIDREMADNAAAGMKEAGLQAVMTTENMPIDSFCQNGDSITFSWQNLIESQIAPGFFGNGFSKLMAFFGKLTDLFGAWIPALLKV